MLMPMGGRPRSTRLVGAVIGAIAFTATVAGSASAAPGTCTGPGARAFDCAGRELQLQVLPRAAPTSRRAWRR